MGEAEPFMGLLAFVLGGVLTSLGFIVLITGNVGAGLTGLIFGLIFLIPGMGMTVKSKSDTGVACTFVGFGLGAFMVIIGFLGLWQEMLEQERRV